MLLRNKISRRFPATLLFQNIKVPKDLAPITRISEENADNADIGITEKNINTIWKAVERFYSSGAHPAITISIRHKGKHIMNRSIGHAKGQAGEPDATLAMPDTPFCLFSASKAITALLIHKLAELEKIDLSAPIATYIPEFGVHGKDNITVDDLLRHRAGVPKLELDLDNDPFDHNRFIERLCNLKLNPLLGTRQAYHALSGGQLLAEIATRATGEPIDTLLDQYFRQPMGMKYFTYGIEEEHREKSADNVCSGMKPIGARRYIMKILGAGIDEIVTATNSKEFHDASIPAGNMYATAEECSRFYQMMLDGGLYNGIKIMEPETIAQAIKAPRFPIFDLTMMLPIRFSSGFMHGGAPVNFFGIGAPNAYGHLGMLNNFTWADPDRELSATILTSGKQVLGPHLLTLHMLFFTINREIGAKDKKRCLFNYRILGIGQPKG